MSQGVEWELPRRAKARQEVRSAVTKRKSRENRALSYLVLLWKLVVLLAVEAGGGRSRRCRVLLTCPSAVSWSIS